MIGYKPYESTETFITDQRSYKLQKTSAKKKLVGVSLPQRLDVSLLGTIIGSNIKRSVY